MKITDFMPRAGFLETQLTGNDLVGAEIGVDVGSHAESLLINCDIKKLYLIDPWYEDFYFGFCKGRILSKGYMNKTEFIRETSIQAVERFKNNSLDFIYFDQKQDYDTVSIDIAAWYPKLKTGGCVVWRGYKDYLGMKDAIDEFLKYGKNYKSVMDDWTREIVIWKE